MMRWIAKKIFPISFLEKLVFLRTVLFDRKTKGMREIKFIKKHQNALILGTGPSLEKDMDRIRKLSGSNDVICVNHFCTNPEYMELKPSKYVFLDKYFFADDAHADWVRQREKTFAIINRQTFWKMQIFIPKWVNDETIRSKITNPNIEILELKLFQSHAKKDREIFRKFDTGYFGPHPCNVLNYAVFIAIWAGYQEIRLFGCDLSLHLDIEVDQESNDVNLRFRYFGRKDRVERFMINPQKREPQTMSSVMATTARTFAAHDVLNRYAERQGVRILNCASFSLIDAYQRERL